MIQTTERLVLREFVEGDWPAVLAYQTDARYLRFYRWTHRTPDDVRAFVQGFVDAQREQPRRKFQLAITLPEQDRLIGCCGIRMQVAGAAEAEIGYELAPGYWGQGYATEAARGMLAFGFADLGLHRVNAHCIAENTRSARVLEKIGLRREGHLRENVWMRGRWWDTLVYGILDHEWEAQKDSRPA